jgi:hypothetical protein
MASVRVTLGISSADVLSTALGLNVATTLVADSGTMIRAKVAATSGAGSGITVYKADDKDTSAYVYVNNLATEFTSTTTPTLMHLLLKLLAVSLLLFLLQ